MITAVPIGGVCLYMGDVAYVSSTPNPAWPDPAGGAVVPAPPSDEQQGALLPVLGWMVCDGRELEHGRYPHLHAVLGNIYGGDPALGVFRLPDLRGLFVRGVDHGAGADPDTAERRHASDDGRYAGVGSIQHDALQVHQHTYGTPGQKAMSGDKGLACDPPLKGVSTSDPISARTSQHETRARNMAVHYIIRVE